jgi:hypothetical protein
MSSKVRRRFGTIAAAFATVLVCAADARAQITQQDLPSEVQSSRLPGWSFTPGAIVGFLYDSNVALAPPDVNKQTAGDQLLAIEPSGLLEFYSPRTSFSGGYRGLIRQYFTITGLNDNEQRASFSLRERMTRRVTLFADNNFVEAASTDLLQLNGVPFLRRGGRYNDFSGGVEARVTRTINLSSHFESTWVDFDAGVEPALRGGLVNGVDTELSRRLTDRVSVGGEYNIRFTSLDAGLRRLMFQELGGTFHYRVSDMMTLDAGGGVADVTDRTIGLTRTGPYVKLDLMRRFERATVGASYHRSYVPSLVFGGTNQSQEATAYLQMPFARNRWYVNASLSLNHTNPLIAIEPPLTSLWVHNLVGYGLSRWLRLEGYYDFAAQDNNLVEGRIVRHLIGVQVAVSQPVRIR